MDESPPSTPPRRTGRPRKYAIEDPKLRKKEIDRAYYKRLKTVPEKQTAYENYRKEAAKRREKSMQKKQAEHDALIAELESLRRLVGRPAAPVVPVPVA